MQDKESILLTSRDKVLKGKEPSNSYEKIFEQFVDLFCDDPMIVGKPLSWWGNKFNFPLHINYVPLIRYNISKFKEVINRYYPNTHIKYAAKVYSHPSMFKIIKEEGLGVDVASYNEFRAALESGIPPELMVLNGNSKEDFLIESAMLSRSSRAT